MRRAAGVLAGALLAVAALATGLPGCTPTQAGTAAPQQRAAPRGDCPGVDADAPRCRAD